MRSRGFAAISGAKTLASYSCTHRTGQLTGATRVLLKLKAEHQALVRKGEAAGSFDEDTLKAMRELEHQQWVHLFGPDRELTVKADLETHLRVRKKVARLRRWRGTQAGLLDGYQRLDDELQLLEAALSFMMAEVDRGSSAG
jgi:hypothetical protein